MKKILSAALSIVMAFSMFANVALGAEKTTNEKFDALKAKGILSGINGNAALDQMMDRASLARVLVTLLGLPASQTEAFNDVPATHWAFGSVNAVAAAGLMIGTAPKTFTPSGNVTVEQVAIVLVKALKVKVKVDTTLPWPEQSAAYVAAAVETGLLTKDEAAKPTAAANRSILVDAVYTAWTTTARKSDVTVVSAKAVDANNIEVVFSDAETAQQFVVDTSLKVGVETEVPVTYKSKQYKVKVTLAPDELSVKSVAAVANNKVIATLDNKATSVDKAVFVVKDAGNIVLGIKNAVLGADGKSVTLVTYAATAYQPYFVTVGGKTFHYIAYPVDTVKPTIASVEALTENVLNDWTAYGWGINSTNPWFPSGLLKVIFSKDIDPVSANNVANYSITGLTITKAEMNADKWGKREVHLTTSKQSAGTIYTLTTQNVADFAGNVMDTNSTIKFGGQDDTTKPKIYSATSDAQGVITVMFTEGIDWEAGNKAENYTIPGLTVESALTYGDNQVFLTTSEQTVGALYTLTVQNIPDHSGNIIVKADVHFAGMKDTTKPTVSKVESGDSTVTITFSEKVDAATGSDVANYTIPSLEVKKAVVDGKKVTLITAKQTVGSIYNLTIQKVADSKGYVMDNSVNNYFGGVNVAPTVVSVTSKGTNSVEVLFNDYYDQASLEDAINYSFDGGLGYPIAAVDDIWNWSKVVTLTTAPQTPGKVYNLTVNNVKDFAGYGIDKNSTFTFAAVATASTSAPKIVAAKAIDKKTILLEMDSDLVAIPTVTINNNDAAKTLMDNTNVQFDGTTKNKLLVSLATQNLAAATLYNAVITNAIGSNGIAMVTDNTILFGGNGVDATGPKAVTALAVDNNTVDVYFDKSIKFSTNAATTAASINLLTQGGTAVKYANNSPVVAQSVTSSTDGKKLTINFYKTGTTLALADSMLFNVEFGSLGAITDLFNQAMVGDTGVANKRILFGSVSTAVAGPAIASVLSIDQYTVDVLFNKDINTNGTLKNAFSLVGTNLPVVALARIEGTNKVRLFFNNPLANIVYTIRYTPNGTDYVAGTNGLKAVVGAGTNYTDALFGGITTSASPAITSLANVNANSIRVSLNQAVGTVASNAIVVKDGATVIDATYYTVVNAADNKSIMVTRTNGVFQGGKMYSIALTTNVKDESNVRAANTDAMTIGGSANLNLQATVADIAGTTTFTLTTFKDLGTNVQTKDLRIRNVATGAVVVAAASKTEAATITGPIGTPLASGTYVIEATDGSVAIYVVK